MDFALGSATFYAPLHLFVRSSSFLDTRDAWPTS